MSSRLSTNLESQRQRVEARLRQKPLTTLEARTELEVMSIAARIYELRHNKGLNIITHWLYVDTGQAVHKVGQYVLLNDLVHNEDAAPLTGKVKGSAND